MMRFSIESLKFANESVQDKKIDLRYCILFNDVQDFESAGGNCTNCSHVKNNVGKIARLKQEGEKLLQKNIHDRENEENTIRR